MPVRVAVVGAGPAGCLVAAALLQAVDARRRALEVSVYGAGPLREPGGPLLLDGTAIARLAALGIPIPSGRAVRGLSIRSGWEEEAAPDSFLAVPRNTLVAILRAVIESRGAKLLPHRLTGLVGSPKTGWRFRVQGAPERADWLILACGAGAEIAEELPDHRPPPTWQQSALYLPYPGDGRVTRLVGNREHPDLWLIPYRDGIWLSATGRHAGRQQWARAVLHASRLGLLGALGPNVGLSQRAVPAGLARPGVPTVGAALGGPPEGLPLGQVAAQAQLTAAALLDGGFSRAIATSRSESRREAPAVQGRLGREGRWRKVREEVREEALRRERRRGDERGPVARSLMAGEALSALELLRLVWALWIAAFILTWRRWTRGASPPESPARRTVYIIEDEAEQASALCEWLQRRGYPCAVFSDGLQAAAAARHDPPAAVILDLALPWIDGAEICRSFKTRREEPPLVLLVTALPISLIPAEQREVADAVLSKPLDLEVLFGHLQRRCPPTEAVEATSSPPPAQQQSEASAYRER